MSKSVCEEPVYMDIYKLHVVSVRNFLFYKLGDLEKARDFTQESFLRLWTNCNKVSFESAKSYLFSIANRLFLDHYAHRKVVLRFEKQSNATEASRQLNPEYLYQEADFKERLEQAISSLPEKERVVFLCSRIDKMKNREIADVLDISIKTVEKRISQALIHVKEMLDLDNVKI